MQAHGSERLRKCTSKYEVRGFDIRNDGFYQDLNTDFGFLSALLWLLRLVDFESLVWFGIVCSSWIWLARCSTRRTLRAPRGNLRAQSVMAGNQTVARTAFLLCVAYAKSATWFWSSQQSHLCLPIQRLSGWARELGVNLVSISGVSIHSWAASAVTQ